jgi:hypothetical protein
MKNILFIIIGIIVYILFFNNGNPISGSGASIDLFVPEVAAGQRKGSGIKKYEFTEMFDQNRLFSSLAKENYYTVVEGYIDTCSICKRLEADFPSFLRKRKDVLIRKVHFPEGNVNVSFSGNTQEEFMQQVAEYHEKMGRYNFNHVVKTDKEYQMSTCGTPHIEIYGPDKQLIASDMCGEKNIKSGLAFLKNWMKKEG